MTILFSRTFYGHLDITWTTLYQITSGDMFPEWMQDSKVAFFIPSFLAPLLDIYDLF